MMFDKRSKKKTDCELVNLRINLEEAKNENSTVLQVLTLPQMVRFPKLVFSGAGKYSKQTLRCGEADINSRQVGEGSGGEAPGEYIQTQVCPLRCLVTGTIIIG